MLRTGTHQQLINKRGAYEHLYSIQNYKALITLKMPETVIAQAFSWQLLK